MSTAATASALFRWIDAYAPGYVTDWGAHFLDIAHWGMDADATGPLEVVAESVARRESGIYDTPEKFTIRYRYPGGARMEWQARRDQPVLAGN